MLLLHSFEVTQAGEEQLCREGPGAVLGSHLVMLSSGPSGSKAPLCPAVYEQEHGQLAEGGDNPPMLGTHGTTAMQFVRFGHPQQGKHIDKLEQCRGGHRGVQSCGAVLLCRLGDQGQVSLGKTKFKGQHCVALKTYRKAIKMVDLHSSQQ